MIQTTKRSQALINFYIFGKQNSHGDTLEQMWKYNDEMLEMKHNYIQWMFPTTRRSMFNWGAPVLAKEDIASLKSNDLMIKNLRKSLSVILRFYGFEVKGNYIFKMDDFELKSKRWISSKNHNYRRLSRILECLTIFELYKLKTELQNVLLEVASANPGIDRTTVSIWQDL